MKNYDICWLPKEVESINQSIFNKIQILGESKVIETIRKEILKFYSSIFGNITDQYNITFTYIQDIDSNSRNILHLKDEINDEGYVIKEIQGMIYIVARTDSGLLYGMYNLIRLIQTKTLLKDINIVENPINKIRMINQWDNMNDSDFMGSVERGYSGHSIFYYDNKFVQNKDRIKDYARLLASIGINAICINNVNVHELESTLITEKFLPDVSKICDIFGDYGIKVYLSINYASSIELGGLKTADPLDIKVRKWWKEKVEEVYKYAPSLGGFLVKADSEGRPGPFTYGRDQADGANLLAEALKPFKGLLIWRCFVYNCTQDWRDRKTDRAKAAYDYFKELDGKFLDNVVLQIKNGPMDFQVREPVSPLLGAMKDTNELVEFQITQEYTGQQKHVCYLIPQWKEVLNFDTYAKGNNSTITRVVSGELYHRRYCGITAVSNVGDDFNWTGHKLAQANLYGYGRLTWNPNLSAKDISEEWIRITFGNDEKVVEIINKILMDSWKTYEKYTSPLGVGWMVEPANHYGANIDGYEYSRWGTYHFADRDGIGVDRTSKGTNYVGQYFKENREIYEDINKCPDELLLFFHHVPYNHILKSGKTVIQHIYDTHFEGVNKVEEFITLWEKLKGSVDDISYENVSERLKIQLDSAIEWRDRINTYFYRKSGIEDLLGRIIYK